MIVNGILIEGLVVEMGIRKRYHVNGCLMGLLMEVKGRVLEIGLNLAKVAADDALLVQKMRTCWVW